MLLVPEECLMRWTDADVRRMIEAGGLEHPECFELVDGLVFEKMGRNGFHAVTLGLCLEAMRGVFAGIARAKSGVPLYLSDLREPEPDVLLVVEVSDASIRKGRTTKAALCARHGIPEYVILDVPNRRAEIRRRPNAEKETWGETLILDENGEFTPLGANKPLRIADLFSEGQCLLPGGRLQPIGVKTEKPRSYR